MLFHQTSQKVFRYVMVALGILIIISMLLMSFPVWN